MTKYWHNRQIHLSMYVSGIEFVMRSRALRLCICLLSAVPTSVSTRNKCRVVDVHNITACVGCFEGYYFDIDGDGREILKNIKIDFGFGWYKQIGAGSKFNNVLDDINKPMSFNISPNITAGYKNIYCSIGPIFECITFNVNKSKKNMLKSSNIFFAWYTGISTEIGWNISNNCSLFGKVDYLFSKDVKPKCKRGNVQPIPMFSTNALRMTLGARYNCVKRKTSSMMFGVCISAGYSRDKRRDNESCDVLAGRRLNSWSDVQSVAEEHTLNNLIMCAAKSFEQSNQDMVRASGDVYREFQQCMADRIGSLSIAAHNIKQLMSNVSVVLAKIQQKSYNRETKNGLQLHVHNDITHDINDKDQVIKILSNLFEANVISYIAITEKKVSFEVRDSDKVSEHGCDFVLKANYNGSIDEMRCKDASGFFADSNLRDSYYFLRTPASGKLNSCKLQSVAYIPALLRDALSYDDVSRLYALLAIAKFQSSECSILGNYDVGRICEDERLLGDECRILVGDFWNGLYTFMITGNDVHFNGVHALEKQYCNGTLEYDNNERLVRVYATMINNKLNGLRGLSGLN